MNKHILMTVCLFSGITVNAAVAADIQSIAWNDENQATHRMTLAPAKFAELCGKLNAGDEIKWRFESTQETNFNIHYHVGKKVVEPVKFNNQAQANGQLNANETQEYCWMWTNTSKDTPARLEVTLNRMTPQ